MRVEIEQIIRKEFIIDARTSVCCCRLYKTLVSDWNGSWQKHGETCFDTSPPFSHIRKNIVSKLLTFSVDLQTSQERLNDAGDLPKWVVEQIDYWPFPKFISIWLVLISSPKERWRWDGCHGIAGIQMARDRRAMDACAPRTSHSKARANTRTTFCRFVKVSPSISRSTLLPRGNNILPVWERNWLFSMVHCGLILGVLGQRKKILAEHISFNLFQWFVPFLNLRSLEFTYCSAFL